MPFFTLPPEDETAGGAEGAKAAEAMFVEGFGKDFDVEAGDAEVGSDAPLYVNCTECWMFWTNVIYHIIAWPLFYGRTFQ